MADLEQDPNDPTPELRSAASKAYDLIVADLLSGRLAPTEDNPASEVMVQERFGLGSRMPVRMALAVLSAEGLIAQRARHGFWVAEVNEDDIRHIAPLRAQGDGIVAVALRARLAEPSADRDALTDRLDGYLGHMRDIGSTVPYKFKSAQYFADADTKFHTAIALTSGYRRGARLIVEWRNLLRLYRTIHGRTYGGSDIEEIVQEHEQIRDSIVGADADIPDIERAVITHVANSIQRCGIESAFAIQDRAPGGIVWAPRISSGTVIRESVHMHEAEDRAVPM